MKKRQFSAMVFGSDTHKTHWEKKNLEDYTFRQYIISVKWTTHNNTNYKLNFLWGGVLFLFLYLVYFLTLFIFYLSFLLIYTNKNIAYISIWDFENVLKEKKRNDNKKRINLKISLRTPNIIACRLSIDELLFGETFMLEICMINVLLSSIFS